METIPSDNRHLCFRQVISVTSLVARVEINSSHEVVSPLLFSSASGIYYLPADIAYLHADRNKTPIIEQMSEVYWTSLYKTSDEAEYLKVLVQKFQCLQKHILEILLFVVYDVENLASLQLSTLTCDVSLGFVLWEIFIPVFIVSNRILRFALYFLSL